MGKEKVYTMPELLKARNNIVAAYGLDIVSAGRLVGYFNGGGPEKRPDIIGDMINGDLSGASVAAAALHISLGVNTPDNDRQPVQGVKNSAGSKKNKIPEKRTTKQSKKEKQAAPGVISFPDTKKSKEGKANNNTAGGGVEKIDGDIVADTPAGVLPDNVAALVQDAIDSYCDNNGVDDLKKDRQTQWKAACIYVGGSVFRNSKILHDVNRERVQGGKVIDVGRVSALVDLWGFLCLKYNKAPMVDDFARFAFVSDSWLYGVECGGNLTPARADILKKLRAMQESGLSGLIVDGRQNPTGALAALNHWHGWTQTREIIHTSGAASVSAPSLPVFDASGGFLEDKSGENSTNV